MPPELDLTPVDAEHELNELLTPSQITALEALLAGETIAAAADEADVDRSTVHRWLKEERVFRRCYDRIRRASLERIRQQTVETARAAADTLQEAIENNKDPWLALQYLQSLDLWGGDKTRETDRQRAPASTQEMRERIENLSDEERDLLRRKSDEIQLMSETGLGYLDYDPETGRVVEVYPFRAAPAGEVLDEDTREKLVACIRAGFGTGLQASAEEE